MYREQWAEDILNGRNLLDCALDVHMTTTGSMERSQEQQIADIKVLNETLLKWRVGHSDVERFDNAVKQLIIAALAESTM
jgi:hypothetical protein